jgi:N-acylneuraminate cytidylyltransferase/CMP-N,N'-diacetyllegionaminic acid synthase
MFRNKKILCVIPARSGSKGLPGKNIMKLFGKPLLVYSVEHAHGSKYIDRTIVSTDSKIIADVAKSWGADVPFLRPKRLALDRSSVIDVLLHAIDWIEKKEKLIFDIIVLLHVTSPLRTIEDVDRSIELLFKKSTENVFSVNEAYRNPYFNMVETDKAGKITLIKKGKYLNRQSAPLVFDMNASIYVWWKDILKSKKSLFPGKTRIYLMPKNRSVDIDDLFDFKLVKLLMKKN